MSRSQRKRGTRVFVQIQQLIGKLIQREPDISKSIRQSFEHVIQFAAASHHMRRNKLIVRPADLLVKLDVRSATQTAPLGVLVKNSADEKRVIANVRPKQKRLLRSGAIQRDQDIGNVLFGEMMCLLGNLQPARVRKCFQQRRRRNRKAFGPRFRPVAGRGERARKNKIETKSEVARSGLE